jgi:hypothetical protein
MKKIFTAGIILGSLVLLSTASFAAGPIVKRQHNQAKRISQGVKSGAITRQELHYLRHDQQIIRQTRNNALRDGHLSHAEKARIARMQNVANRHINRAKTNNRHFPCCSTSCKPVSRQVRMNHPPVRVHVPSPAVVAGSGGILGVTVAQPGWSLAWSSVIH